MVGAVLAHIFRLHTNPAAAVVLLVLNVVLAWLRRGELAALRGRRMARSETVHYW
jgi:hypothetical protein